MRCQAYGRRGRLDVRHVIKRSRGGSDFDLDGLVALCRACHDQTDAPLAAGRLIVTPMGDASPSRSSTGPQSIDGLPSRRQDNSSSVGWSTRTSVGLTPLRSLGKSA